MALTTFFQVVDFFSGLSLSGLFATRAAALRAAPGFCARRQAFRVVAVNVEAKPARVSVVRELEPKPKSAITASVIRALCDAPTTSDAIRGEWAGLMENDLAHVPAAEVVAGLEWRGAYIAEALGVSRAVVAAAAVAYRQWDVVAHQGAHREHVKADAAKAARKQAIKDAISAAVRKGALIDGNNFEGRCACCREHVRTKRGYYSRTSRSTVCADCIGQYLDAEPKAAPAKSAEWWAREVNSDKDALVYDHSVATGFDRDGEAWYDR